ncbi:hypothetical protein [Paenibacillus cremeus]|uniref:Uncharacterized protein n=1 Tax=Paenibacillus cremeus TaxID=2163881 RepID=A0A559KCN1_9BACL|nr:hypothetical protein [Paenibacillus cremeus]TVY09863.1 hypothetical protein FPZ49_10850 [Paenibacillus cremeus]
MTNNHATNEEMELIKKHIILPLMLDVVQKNIEDLSLNQSTLKPLYIASCEAVMNLIHQDMAENRKLLKQANIKIFDRDQSKYPLFHYPYMVRGYHFTFQMRRELIKSEMSTMLPKYVNRVIQIMNGQ